MLLVFDRAKQLVEKKREEKMRKEAEVTRELDIVFLSRHSFFKTLKSFEIT